MKLPSKVTPYKDSILAKFPIVLTALQECDMTPSELYKKIKNKVGTFASAILLGLYSIFVGLLLLVIYFVASPRDKGTVAQIQANE